MNFIVNEVMSMESESDTQSSNQQKVQDQNKTALPKIVIQAWSIINFLVEFI